MSNHTQKYVHANSKCADQPGLLVQTDRRNARIQTVLPEGVQFWLRF